MKWTRGPTIGRGSTATVSTAVVHPVEELVAVKSVEPTRWRLLRNEQKIHSTIRCPYIIEYKGQNVTFENGTLMYNIFLEFAPLGNLSGSIAKLRRTNSFLDEATISWYSRSILKGVEYLHSNRIVHCDIKPSNILVTGADVGVKIADFGCSKLVDDMAGSNWPTPARIAGTPIYMAPEVARGEQQGYPADVWALGCTVIEMATGQAPWPGASDPVSVLYHIGFSGQEPDAPKFLSDQAKDFLSKCLCKDPEQRWSAAQLLQHPFVSEAKNPGHGSCSGSPTSVLDTGLSSPIWDPAQTPNMPKAPAERIRKLIEPGSGMKGLSNVPGWDSDSDDESYWVTVRSYSTGEAYFCDEVEVESTSFDMEWFGNSFISYFGDYDCCNEVIDVICSTTMASNAICKTIDFVQLESGVYMNLFCVPSVAICKAIHFGCVALLGPFLIIFIC